MAMVKGGPAKAPAKGRFSGIEDASVTVRHPFIPLGDHVFQVDKLSYIESRKNGDLFLAEGRIIESDNPNVRIGKTYVHMVGMKLDGALGLIKAFLAPLLNVEISEVTEAVCEAAVDEQQNEAFLGRKVRASGTERIGRDSGKAYTAINWTAVDDQEPLA